MNENELLGFVTGLRWGADQLHGRMVIKTVIKGNADPFTVGMQGIFAAKKHKDGMVLEVVTTRKDGEKSKWPVSQKQADSIFVNQQGHFEIAEI